MANSNCPTLSHITNDDQCMENFAGLGSVAYIFLKDDINKAKLAVAADDPTTYEWKDASGSGDSAVDGTFKTGKGFYKLELKENSQSFTGESQGARKGYKISGNLVIEVVNKAVSKLLRGLNNLDYGIILPDGDDYQIMYSPTQKITRDAGSLKTDTGAAASDDRIATLTPVLENVKYPNLWVSFPEGKTADDYVLAATSGDGE